MKHLPVAALLALAALLLPACQAQPDMVLASSQAPADERPGDALAKTTRPAAVALLDALTDAQRAKATRPMTSDLRKDWHFVPRQRAGVMLGELDADQKKLVHNLMQTALSESGYLKATDIIWLETVLYEMSNQNPMRDPGKYALLIFGDPADKDAAWGWRLEGHHLSLNLTYTPEGIGVTPLFFGTNPAVVQQGPLAGKRVLADAHNLAVELAKSMNEEQRAMMMLDGKPRDIITGPGREMLLHNRKDRLGIDSEKLDQDQRTLFRLLTSRVLINHLEQNHMLATIRQIGRNATRDDNLVTFAWAGPIDADKPFYYRIHSAGMLFEYSCQGRNHVHSVIHDLTDPLQEDLLKKHFEQHDHGADE